MKAYVGTSGWQYKHWNKRFFPPGLPQKHQLEYLSRHFDTVELNTTFYHLARMSAFAKWRRETPAGFLFAVKAYRLFTHVRRLNLRPEDQAALAMFAKGLAVLGPKLGPVLIQLPPSLKWHPERLEDFVRRLRRLAEREQIKLSLALEARHPSWFNQQVFSFIRRLKLAWVITNSPHWPAAIVKTASFVYVRFHGREKLFASNYTDSELRRWHKELLKLRPRRVFAYFNNDANAYAARNALYFAQLFNKSKSPRL